MAALFWKYNIGSCYIFAIHESQRIHSFIQLGQMCSYVGVCVCVCVYSGLTSFSTIFQSYHDGVWLRQGAQCSLL